MLKIAYLAVPYTHEHGHVMEARYKAVTKAAAALLNGLGYNQQTGKPHWPVEGVWEKPQYVFSPITHTHPIKVMADLSDLWEEWAGYDSKVIYRLCSSLIVLQLDGWEESVGVTAEIELAMSIDIPIRFLHPSMIDMDDKYPYFEITEERSDAPNI